MSRLGEQTLLILNQFMPDFNRSLLSAKSQDLTYVEFFEHKSSGSFALFGDLDLAGQVVLDVGCGLGANLAHICALGARHVIALDVDSAPIKRSRNILSSRHPALAARVQFVTADAANMPLENHSVDTIISADTFEHIPDLDSALSECARILKPGGLLYAYFPPFFAPWGAHMTNWIRLPWCQVLFAESTLVRVARQLDQQGKSANSKLPAETRLDPGNGDIIPFVNHLTVHRFQELVDRSHAWRVKRRALLPPMWRTRRWISAPLFWLTSLPILQEMFTAKAVFVLQKLTQP